jgi:hypothetical protein
MTLISGSENFLFKISATEGHLIMRHKTTLNCAETLDNQTGSLHSVSEVKTPGPKQTSRERSNGVILSLTKPSGNKMEALHATLNSELTLNAKVNEFSLRRNSDVSHHNN